MTQVLQPTSLAQRGPRRGLRLAQVAMAAALLVLAACASTPPPTAQMALANAAVTSAAAAGGVEMAPAEMALSREKLRRAQTAMDAKDHDTALMLSQQAQADAQLAQAKAEAEKARRSALALQEAGRALREEMARQPR
jgi:membrane-bound lytic murein transglycosylase